MIADQDDIWTIIREGVEGLSVKILPIKDINDLLIVRNYSEEIMAAMVQSTAKFVDVILEVSYN
jgi:hypothetical protein